MQMLWLKPWKPEPAEEAAHRTLGIGHFDDQQPAGLQHLVRGPDLRSRIRSVLEAVKQAHHVVVADDPVRNVGQEATIRVTNPAGTFRLLDAAADVEAIELRTGPGLLRRAAEVAVCGADVEPA